MDTISSLSCADPASTAVHECRIAFYRGRGLLAFLTRLGTWRIGQKFSAVPFHVNVVIGGIVTESVRSGVRQREWGSSPDDASAVQFVLPICHSAQIVPWLSQQLGKPYDYAAAWLDVLGIVDPKWLKLPVHTQKRWNCSRMVAQVIKMGGWSIAADMAISPNDVLRWLEKWDFKRA